jgi:GNAT superfamily N-acetyltransferase
VSRDAVAGDELATALAADLAARLRACPESVAIDDGWSVRSTRLAPIHHLNAIVLGTVTSLDPGVYDAGAIERLARRWQGDRTEQCVVIDDEPVAERLAVELAAHGWERVRTLFMALRDGPPAIAPDARARALSEDELRALQPACFAEQGFGPRAASGLPALLAEAQALLRATTPALRFGAGPVGGEPASMCTLFLDEDVGGRRVATVEAVATLRDHREQGLARAAVGAAIRAAGEWRADLIVVPADADDWPQLMYASLGFAPIGRRWQFVRSERVRRGRGVASPT